MYCTMLHSQSHRGFVTAMPIFHSVFLLQVNCINDKNYDFDPVYLHKNTHRSNNQEKYDLLNTIVLISNDTEQIRCYLKQLDLLACTPWDIECLKLHTSWGPVLEF